MEQITLKVFVNKTKNCVAFVESELDFVDVLLSFLTLPVGTVIRLLNKKSFLLGCFDKLYQGVEQLDEKYFATAACKSMLTNPVNSSGVKCQKLKINIDEMGELYTCTSKFCSYRALSYYSSNLKCHCGDGMHRPISYDLNEDSVNYEEFRGVFIEGDNFFFTDALLVVSIKQATSYFVDCYGDGSGLEERCVRIGRAQVLQILKRSLISDTPLTDVLLRNRRDASPEFSVPPVEKTVAIKAFDKAKKIYRIKLALVGNKVLYAEASQDFVNEIFSFLTFPLGALKKQLGNRCRIGCLNNLYDSATQLDTLGYIVTGCKETLVNPKLPPYFNCNNRVIRVEVEKEKLYFACDYRRRLSATRYHCSDCGHSGRKAKRALLIDPKTSRDQRLTEGSFCKELTYMVSDELVVTPFSFTSIFSLHRQTSEPIKMVEMAIGEEEVLDLLSSASSSKAALTDAFFARANGVLTSMDEKAE